MAEDISLVVDEIHRLARRLKSPIKIMEVCGTHTVNIQRSGIRGLLPSNIRLVSGPGCPVCVSPSCYIDDLVRLAEKGYVIATYGDMLKVPSDSGRSLIKARGMGYSIRVVLSAFDALEFAKKNPDKEIVFAAVGFETTAPATADVVIRAEKEKVENFYVLVAHKLVIPAMEALLSDGRSSIDGFLCPGHVSVIIGSDSYKSLVEKYGRPAVIGGFEPIQILLAIKEIVSQIVEGSPSVGNVYSFAVRPSPQEKAWQLLWQVFDIEDSYWRAIGLIPRSGLRLKGRYLRFDASALLDSPARESESHISACRCGDVMKGIIDPVDCPLFGVRCTPQDPVGPCMVSSEGACQAWFKYSS